MLTPDKFAGFIGDVHTPPDASPDGRRAPFPWQQALLDRIVADGKWPEVIDVPTGLGKTSVLDVAVFVAAMKLAPARRRIFFVVDRRLVVDDAHDHARRIADALADPSGRSVVAEVANALRQPGDDHDRVLEVTRMRGGVTWEWLWLERPDRFAIVTGTVDQVGSRLLFRGYGVGENLRSIDAALVGTDSLIVVDEAHLARPFRETLGEAFRMDQPTSGSLVPPTTLVSMSATSGTGSERTQGITIADEQHPIAGARLHADKLLRLVEVKTTKAKAAEQVPDALAAIAAQLAPQRVVGVVVNTVSRARAVFSRIRTVGLEGVLLTGRSRPADREQLLDRHYRRISVDRDRPEPASFVVVATQTIEVGANIDVDALVTESAPLPSLVQRLGRLNRMAKCSELPAPAVIVHDSAVDHRDPVYGAARLATWEYLSAQTAPERYSPRWSNTTVTGLAASPAALRRLASAAELNPEDVYVPVLWPAVLDAWVRTSPTPRPDQPVAPYLHGIERPRQPVILVWRAGLPEDAPGAWGRIVDQLPPTPDESLELDLHTVRRWLAEGRADLSASDVEAVPEPEEDRIPAGVGRPALRYAKRGEGEVVTGDRIRPGDTLVVPHTYGGCDEFGWHPDSREPVLDLADVARRRRRGPILLRIGPTLSDLLAARYPGHDDAAAELLELADRDPPAGAAEYQGALARLAHVLVDSEGGRPERMLWVVRTIASANKLTVISGDQLNEDGRPIGAGYRVLLSCGQLLLGDDDTEADSSGAREALALQSHQRAVERRAREFAENLGLGRVAESVAAAARWHDEGKRDMRFQAMLHRGDRRRAALATELLAKSDIDPADRIAFRRAWRRSRYPAGMRHEALSARIAVTRVAGRPDLDESLVVHLVASHHGRARPLLPPVLDDAPEKVMIETGALFHTAATVDWNAPRRFADLTVRYGRWGLALLEAIVRLADIWCSAREERCDESQS